MAPKQPVGECPICGQQFMTRQGMQNHIDGRICMRDEPEVPEPPKPLVPKISSQGRSYANGRTTVWVRGDDDRF